MKRHFDVLFSLVASVFVCCFFSAPNVQNYCIPNHVNTSHQIKHVRETEIIWQKVIDLWMHFLFLLYSPSVLTRRRKRNNKTYTPFIRMQCTAVHIICCTWEKREKKNKEMHHSKSPNYNLINTFKFHTRSVRTFCCCMFHSQYII